MTAEDSNLRPQKNINENYEDANRSSSRDLTSKKSNFESQRTGKKVQVKVDVDESAKYDLETRELQPQSR